MSDQDKLQTRLPSVMEDPSARAVAAVYADAFLTAIAQSNANADEQLEELESFITDVLEPNDEFRHLLLDGRLGRDDKIQLLERVVDSRCSEILSNFLKVLSNHDRLEGDFLPLVLHQSRIKHETRTGKKRVQVTSAKELSEEARNQINDRLRSTFSFEPILETHVDESLIGGLVIQVDDTVYDSSVRTRLKQMRSHLRQRSLNEIQSGRDRFSNLSGD